MLLSLAGNSYSYFLFKHSLHLHPDCPGMMLISMSVSTILIIFFYNGVNIFSYKVANNFHPFCSGMLLISMSVSTMPRVLDHPESYFLILSPTAEVMVNHG